MERPRAVLVVATAALALSAPGQTIGVSVFITPMARDLGLSLSLVSAAYMAGTLAGALGLPLVGRLIDRSGARRSFYVVVVAFSMALMAMAGVSSFMALVAGFAAIRLFGQGALSLVSTTSVALAFREAIRPRAIGFNLAVGGGLMALAPFLLERLIRSAGWRASWAIAAAVVAMILLPAIRWIPAELRGRRHYDANLEVPSLSLGDAARVPRFWALTGAVAFTGMAATGLAFHQVALLTSQGLSTTQAAANFLVQMVVGVVASLSVGRLASRLRDRHLISSSLIVLGFAPLFAVGGAPLSGAVAYAVALGGSHGAIKVLEGTLYPKYFGIGNLATIRGVVFSVTVAATALGPLLLSLALELTGSWEFAVVPLAVVSLGMAAWNAMTLP